VSARQRLYYRVLNAVMRVLLRSPLHGLRSGRVLLLEFRGRKSGRRYRMPVSYWERAPSQVVCLTSTKWSRWWLNLQGAEVVLWLRGRARAGRAELVADPGSRRELVSGFLRHNAHDAPVYGVGTDAGGRPLEADLEALAGSAATKVLSIAMSDRDRPDPLAHRSG
jgi:hypothetical protein